MKTKNYLKVILFVFVGTFILGSCKKDEKIISQNVEGTYFGSFTSISTLKSAQVAANVIGSATAVVTKINDEQIGIHCFGDDLDSTFILNTYQNGDSLMVCLNGQDFDHEYGHMMGNGNMMGNNSTAWGHHMNGEHKVGDQHFGGFNMQNGTFGYSFKMKAGTSTSYLKFQGEKK